MNRKISLLISIVVLMSLVGTSSVLAQGVEADDVLIVFGDEQINRVNTKLGQDNPATLRIDPGIPFTYPYPQPVPPNNGQPIDNCPLRVIVIDENGLPVPNYEVEFEVRAGGGYFTGDPAVFPPAPPQPVTKIMLMTAGGDPADPLTWTPDWEAGRTADIRPGEAQIEYTLGTVAGAWEGNFFNNEVTVTIATSKGPRMATFHLGAVPDAPADHVIVSGDGQEGLILTTLPEDLTVEVRDQWGNPYYDPFVAPALGLAERATVTFTASGTALLPDVNPNDVPTGNNGRASVALKLGDVAGGYTVDAQVTDPPLAKIVTFNATAILPPHLPTHFGIIAGDNQHGTPGEPLDAVPGNIPLSVEVLDKDNNPVPGWEVNFKITKGTGTLPGGQISISVTADTNGVAEVVPTLGWYPIGDDWENKISATIARFDDQGHFGGIITHEFTAIADPPTDMFIAAGDKQVGTVAQAVAAPLEVEISNGLGFVKPYTKVLFEVTEGPASGGGPEASLAAGGVVGAKNIEVKTDPTTGVNPDSAVASVALTLGSKAGESNNVVHATTKLWRDDHWEDFTLVFTATANPDVANSITAVLGDGQEEVVGIVLPDPLTVVVKDQFGNHLLAGPAAPGEVVTFNYLPPPDSADAKGALLADPATSTTTIDVNTDANGRAASPFRLGETVGSYKIEATTAAGALKHVFEVKATNAPGTIITIDSGNNQQGLVGQELANPLKVVVKDQYGNLVPNWVVTFEVTEGACDAFGICAELIGDNPATTGADGTASINLKLGPVIGLNKVKATINTGQATIEKSVEFEATAYNPSTIEIVAGDNQHGTVNPDKGYKSILNTPLEVLVKDADGNPVTGMDVTFEIEQGVGEIRPAAQPVQTDAAGKAAITLVIGPTDETDVKVKAEAEGVGRVTFTAHPHIGYPGEFYSSAAGFPPEQAPGAPPWGIQKAGGDGQLGIVNTDLPNPLKVNILDRWDNLMIEVPVSFDVSGQGSFSGSTHAEDTTNEQGEAEVVLTLGKTASDFPLTPPNHEVTASVDGILIDTDGVMDLPHTFSVKFNATALHGPPAYILVEGDEQVNGKVARTLSANFKVTVRDEFDNPVIYDDPIAPANPIAVKFEIKTPTPDAEPNRLDGFVGGFGAILDKDPDVADPDWITLQVMVQPPGQGGGSAAAVLTLGSIAWTKNEPYTIDINNPTDTVDVTVGKWTGAFEPYDNPNLTHTYKAVANPGDPVDVVIAGIADKKMAATPVKTTTVSLQVEDVFDNPVPGIDVNMSLSDITRFGLPLAQATAAKGTIEAKAKPIAADITPETPEGSGRYVAEYTPGTFIDERVLADEIQIVADGLTPGTGVIFDTDIETVILTTVGMDVTVDPIDLPADGSSKSNITIMLHNVVTGEPMNNQDVKVEMIRGNGTVTPVIHTGDGEYKSTYNAPTIPTKPGEDEQIRVTVTGDLPVLTRNLTIANDPFDTYNGAAPAVLTDVAVPGAPFDHDKTIVGSIKLTPDGIRVALELKANKSVLDADGADNTQITVIVKAIAPPENPGPDYPIPNIKTKLEIVKGGDLGGTLDKLENYSDDVGEWTATYTAGTKPGAVQIKATVVTTGVTGDPHTLDLSQVTVDQSAPVVLLTSDPDTPAAAGAPLTITASISDTGGAKAGIESATLKYKVGGKGQWFSIPITVLAGYPTTADVAVDIPIADESNGIYGVSPRGLAYYLIATDQSGNIGSLGSAESPISQKTEGTIAAVKSPTLPLQDDDTFIGWSMVTLPLDVDDPNAFLTDKFAQIALWNADIQDWDASMTLTPGAGAFALTATPVALDVTGVSRDITTKLSIPIKPGWNLLANPYSFGRYWNKETISVESDGVEIPITEAADYVLDQIWWYNPDVAGNYEIASANPDIYYPPAALSPFSAFWVLAFKECNLSISPIAAGPDDVPPSPAAPVKRSLATLSNLKPPSLPSSLLTASKPVSVTKVYQNYPNPFNPETWLPYQLAEDANVVISIYDVSGNLVRELRLGNQQTGLYLTKDKAAYWDGRNEIGEKIASGLYFYRLRAGSFTSPVKRMVILK